MEIGDIVRVGNLLRDTARLKAEGKATSGDLLNAQEEASKYLSPRQIDAIVNKAMRAVIQAKLAGGVWQIEVKS